MSAVNGLHVAELRTLLAAITPTSASAEGAPPLALCVDETAAIDALLAKVGAEAVEHYWGAHRRPRRWGGAEYEAAEISIELMVAPSLHWPQRTCHTRASTCIRRSPPNLQLKSAISSDSCSRVRSCKAAYTPRSRLCQHCSAMVWRRANSSPLPRRTRCQRCDANPIPTGECIQWVMRAIHVTSALVAACPACRGPKLGKRALWDAL
jgi:hypothetical protein